MWSFCVLQEHETEYSMAQMMESGCVRKADPSQFELLKVLGQGSFGKVRVYFQIFLVLFKRLWLLFDSLYYDTEQMTVT